MGPLHLHSLEKEEKEKGEKRKDRFLGDLYSSADHPSIRKVGIPPFSLPGRAKVGLWLRVWETQS